MDIHKETTLKNVKDTELLKRMVTFAKPHWKPILLSIVMAALIVAATLVQPYLVKVAIDDRINGIYKLMIAVNMTDAEQAQTALKQAGWKLDDEIHWGDAVYYRVSSAKEFALPEAAWKAKIVSTPDGKWLVNGWPSDADWSNEGTGASADDTSNDGKAQAILLSDDDVKVFRSSDFSGFLFIGLLFLVAVGVSAILNYVQMYTLERTGQSIIYSIRQAIFAHLSRLQTSFYDKNPVGRLVTRVSHDVEALNQLYTQVIVNLVKEVCMLVGIVIVMLQLNVELSLMSFTVIPVLVVITFYYRGIARQAQRLMRLILSRLNAFLAENLSGIHITQIFNREKKQNEQFNHMNQDYYRAGMRGTIINSIFNPTIGFIGNIALAVVVWYGGKSILSGALTFGIVYAFTQYVQQFYKPLMGLADRYNQIQTALASAERIFELLDEEPAIVNPKQPKPLPKVMTGAIDFENVWFAYNKEQWVLKGIDLRIKPGETVAFVGATGAGKTSVISLLNRFYDIQKGSIRIDGIDVREVELEALRRRIGVIQQDAYVFTGDVYFNIRLHNLGITDRDIEEAAAHLKMDQFIKMLPQGFRTPLGEQGYTLSSGQRQLLAFLRTYVHQPDILILDEATASIDSETEQVMQEGLSTISKDRTTLIVAHRLSTIRDADKIIVMQKGEIREVGTHEELLRMKGYYYRLYDLQHSKNTALKGTKGLAVQ